MWRVARAWLRWQDGGPQIYAGLRIFMVSDVRAGRVCSLKWHSLRDHWLYLSADLPSSLSLYWVRDFVGSHHSLINFSLCPRLLPPYIFTGIDLDFVPKCSLSIYVQKSQFTTLIYSPVFSTTLCHPCTTRELTLCRVLFPKALSLPLYEGCMVLVLVLLASHSCLDIFEDSLYPSLEAWC